MLMLRDLMNPNMAAKPASLTLPGGLYLQDVDPGKLIGTVSEYVRITGEDGRIAGAVKTERLCYLIEKQRDAEFLQILDALDVGIVAIDRDSRIFYVNPAYAKILGVETAKILGRYMSVIEPDAALLQVLKTGKPRHIDKQLIHSVGTFVSASMYPLLTASGGDGRDSGDSRDSRDRGDGEAGETGAREIQGAFSIFTDITQLNMLHNEVRRISQVAEEYNRQIEAKKLLDAKCVIGESKSWMDCIDKALKVAHTDAMVLLRGENGSGKEIVADIIRENSARKNKPFITVNCSAIPESLIESELFGYEEGAFTGASKGGKLGKFQLADGGTLFLDEIGDMPFHMQAKLLRALQEGEVEKVGRQENVPVDVRVIAATNKSLEDMVRAGTFREDLYYRLNVITITLPPLRQRGNDVLLLADHFLQQYNQKYHRAAAMDRSVLQALLNHSWPGNVRELKHTVESAVVLCDGDLIRVKDLPAALQQTSDETAAENLLSKGVRQETSGDADGAAGRAKADGSAGYQMRCATLKEEVEAFERQVIADVLAQCGGNRQQAMKRLGLPKRTFYRKIAKNGTDEA